MESVSYVTWKNSKGMGLIEVMLTVGILAGIALVAATFITSTRKTNSNMAQNSAAHNAVADIATQLGATGGAQVLNVPITDRPKTFTGASTTERQDPLCCDEAGKRSCTNTRRTVLCGSITNHPEDQAVVRNAATWARNFYAYCKASNCGLTDQGGSPSICGTGLVFNSTGELNTFYHLLPTPLTEEAYNANLFPKNAPQEITIKIDVYAEGATSATACGSEPTWTKGAKAKVTLTVIPKENAMALVTPMNLRRIYGGLLAGLWDLSLGHVEVAYAQGRGVTYTFNLGWVLDTSGARVVAGGESIKTGGDNQSVNIDPANAANIDNRDVDLVNNAEFDDQTGTLYNQDGSVRVIGGVPMTNAYCAGNYFETTVGQGYQNPDATVSPAARASVYVGWDKIFYGLTVTEPNVTMMCKAGPAASASELNVTCASLYSGASGNYPSGSNFTVTTAWDAALAEGTVIGVGFKDGSGNQTLVRNIVATPAYCPRSTDYCADGSRFGLEVDGQAAGLYPAAGPGATCPAQPSLPSYANWESLTDIGCRPHDGCFRLCGPGTRAMQRCKDPATFCNVGGNLGTRGCEAGVDCTVDQRCGDNVCDDCGVDNCPVSTIAVGSRGECTAYGTGFYCPTGGAGVTKPSAASGADVAAGPYTNVGNYTRTLGNPWYLPKDACGNDCLASTVPDPYNWYDAVNGRETGCPSNTASYCKNAGDNHAAYLANTALHPNTCENAGVDCTVNAHDTCGGRVCDTCGRDSCPVDSIPALNACPATNGYCPDDDSIGGPVPNGAVVNGPDAAHQIPLSTCANRCPSGTMPSQTGCPAYVCGTAPTTPRPNDTCGRSCNDTPGCPTECSSAQAQTCTGFNVKEVPTGNQCDPPYATGSKAWYGIEARRCAPPAPAIENGLACDGLNFGAAAGGSWNEYYSGGAVAGTKPWDYASCAAACAVQQCGALTTRSCTNAANDPWSPNTYNSENCNCAWNGGTPGGVVNLAQCGPRQGLYNCGLTVYDECGNACPHPTYQGTNACCNDWNNCTDATRRAKFVKYQPVYSGCPTGLTGGVYEGVNCETYVGSPGPNGVPGDGDDATPWGITGTKNWTAIFDNNVSPTGTAHGFDGDFGDLATTCEQNRDKIDLNHTFVLRGWDDWSLMRDVGCPVLGTYVSCTPNCGNPANYCSGQAVPDLGGCGTNCGTGTRSYQLVGRNPGTFQIVHNYSGTYPSGFTFNQTCNLSDSDPLRRSWSPNVSSFDASNRFNCGEQYWIACIDINNAIHNVTQCNADMYWMGGGSGSVPTGNFNYCVCTAGSTATEGGGNRADGRYGGWPSEADCISEGIESGGCSVACYTKGNDEGHQCWFCN